MIEIWYPLDFIGCNNYDVSNQGRVRKHTKHSTRLMMLNTTATGHVYVRLTIDGVQNAHSVAKLVLEAFRASKETSMHKYVLHLDGNRTNNSIDNLRWATRNNSIRYHRSYIRESESRDCMTRPVLETNSRRLYKSVLEAARELVIPPIDIYNQCAGVYSPECEAWDERFSWVHWE